ncbi:unnamed protein product [Lymnaea stagnalis]|uniref:Uncharacterized protein n=1 Tax=Lymnaea stagnalis TaxID=6523 RepID=A0AAV2I767_LYMST
MADTDINQIISEAKVDNLFKVVVNGRQKYICSTRNNGKSLVFQVTDGVDVWLLDLDEDGLKAHSETGSIAVFLLKIHNGFLTGEISIGRIGTKVTLSLGKDSSVINLELYEAMAAEKKNELQSLLYMMAEDLAKVKSELSLAKEQLLNTQKSSNSGLGLVDLSPKKTAGRTKVKKVGMSAVNPFSRKRKAATGVVFEEK